MWHFNPHLNMTVMWILLIGLIILSAFFSVAETAYMSVNRYKLRHIAKSNKRHQRKARKAQQLLSNPDQLLGVVLMSDTFADILASSIATLIALHYFGPSGIIIATLVLTFVVLVFGQLAPKTIAAMHPIPIVLYSAWPLWILLKTTYPLVYVANGISRIFLWCVGVKKNFRQVDLLSTDELRTIITDSTPHMPSNYQEMLLHLLDLEKMYVEDIMVPRSEVVGIDLDKPLSEVIDNLKFSQHTRIVVFEESIDNTLGFLHVKNTLSLWGDEPFSLSALKKIIEKPIYIPEGTSLGTLLLQCCQQKIRIGFVVDEYGEILGLVTLEDILEEIVGEFTTEVSNISAKNILLQKDGSYLIDGSVHLRTLNRKLGWHFPLDGPKTLSGLIVETLEMIPPPNICVNIAGVKMEILQVKDNIIKTIRTIK